MRRRNVASILGFFLPAVAGFYACFACSSSSPTAGTVGASSTAGASTVGSAGSSNARGAGGLTAAGGSAGASGSTSVAGSSGSAGATAIAAPKEPLSKYIVVDQFGYRPDAEKIAVIRDPQTGFDAAESFTPGKSYALVDAVSGARVETKAVTPWNAGATDMSSGDVAWWFDFSDITQPGTYYVLDVDNAVRSDVFDISDTVYREVLKRVLRMFFYQRAGQAKDAKWAGAGWADTADHVGPGQDHNCRAFLDKTNSATEKDLWGGWFDAGDYNKYTIGRQVTWFPCSARISRTKRPGATTTRYPNLATASQTSWTRPSGG